MDSIKLICLGKYSWYPLLGIRSIFSLYYFFFYLVSLIYYYNSNHYRQ